jgi:hypothetical protein
VRFREWAVLGCERKYSSRSDPTAKNAVLMSTLPAALVVAMEQSAVVLRIRSTDVRSWALA